MPGGYPALYITELQLVAAAQRQGIGRLLTAATETLAWDRGLALVMLTVQTANVGALEFYKRLGYESFPLSPECCPDEFDAEVRKS